MDNKITITSKCKKCGKEMSLKVYEKDFNDYENNKNIDLCFPYLSISDRELMLTGICNECWNIMFNM